MASFREQIQVHAGTGGFVSRADERALLRLGTAGYGLDFDGARGAVLDAAATESLVLESAVEQAVGDYLQSRAGPGGRVSRSMFQSAVDLYRSSARGMIGPEQAASRVKDLMVRRGLTPRGSGLLVRSRRWFNRIPRPAEAAAAEVALPAPPAAAVQAPVQATLQAWEAAFSSRDVAGVLALYAPDALLLATGSPVPLRGPAAMRGYFEKLLIAQSAVVRFDSTLDVDGTDPAVASGLYVFTWIDPALGTVANNARFTFVVTRSGPGPLGTILQHHSSAVPDGIRGTPV